MKSSVVVPWALRIVWASLPFSLGPALEGALDERGLAVARTAGGLGWLVWAAGLLALAIPRTVGLTALRSLAPLVPATAIWGATADDDPGAAAVVGLIVGVLALLLAFAPTVGDWLVNGSSYGDERRMPLRPPAGVLLGPVQVVWLLLVVTPIAGALLLGARAWIAGAVVLAGWAVAARPLARVLHALSRRWVVFVPAGLVLHDQLVMLDPVLFPRSAITRVGPAPADASPTDLTGGALGLALQLDLRDTLQVAPRHGREVVTPVDVTAVRFTPTRPGAVVAEA
ncbi:MAG: hypothetical protein M3Z03_17375, partial [Actinomycetota bacterium]|nr:hypothetical protein [Actinomycetota bacterium]